MNHYLSTQHYEDVYYLPPAEWLPVFSLGYRKALCDLIWMKALIYFGEELYHRGNVKHLYEYTEAMLKLDKYFNAVYLWVSSASIYRPGEVTVADVRMAIKYLERGIRLFPNDGELAWDLGANYVYELAPILTDHAEKVEARKLGIPYLQAAALRGAGPRWLGLTNATQLIELGRTEQAIRHLEALYSTITNPDTREEIEDRLAALRNSSYVEAMKHVVKELEQSHQRDFPYLSQTLYLLVGPRPLVDEAASILNNFDPLADIAVEEANLEN
jgi:tetratricopeptide (TPR) repeat protein